MKEANDQSSSAIGREVGTKLGSTMSCEHLTDRHNLLAEALRAKANVPREQPSNRKPLNSAEIPGDILKG
jgi:hypothetical protein